jgi:hypothetical protein
LATCQSIIAGYVNDSRETLDNQLNRVYQILFFQKVVTISTEKYQITIDFCIDKSPVSVLEFGLSIDRMVTRKNILNRINIQLNNTIHNPFPNIFHYLKSKNPKITLGFCIQR